MRNIFLASSSKLEDCRTNLRIMKSAKNTPAFKAAFTSFLSSARAITYALQKEGTPITGFRDWYTVKQEEMKNDPLLRFIHTARTNDFHEGKHNLRFSTYINHFSTNNLGSPPSPNAPIVIRADGIFQIVDKDTAKERRVPIETGKYQISISIDNPPTEHLGKMIVNRDPITICELALGYYESLIYEANKIFGS